MQSSLIVAVGSVLCGDCLLVSWSLVWPRIRKTDPEDGKSAVLVSPIAQLHVWPSHRPRERVLITTRWCVRSPSPRDRTPLPLSRISWTRAPTTRPPLPPARSAVAAQRAAVGHPAPALPSGGGGRRWRWLSFKAPCSQHHRLSFGGVMGLCPLPTIVEGERPTRRTDPHTSF